MESEQITAETPASEINDEDKLLVPSLRGIASKYLQPSFPPEDERYFELNSMPLWSFRRNSSSEEGSESEDIVPDEGQIGVCSSKINKSRFITLKTPKLQILMDKKEFLDHCDLVRNGSKGQQQAAMFYLDENKSEPNIHRTTNILVANCSVDMDVNFTGEHGKKEISDQNQLAKVNERDTSSNFKKGLNNLRKSDSNVERGVADNNFLATDDDYGKKSVVDLIKHFEQIHLRSKPNQQPKKKTSGKELSKSKK